MLKQEIKDAVRKGYLNLLIIYHEKGGPWSTEMCEEAARYGHIDCLKYLHKNGCSWDQWTCDYAAMNGHIECLKYAHENGCPYPKVLLSTIVKKILIPKWRDSVKSRLIVYYWMELSAQTSCAENGRARIEDMKSFENDCNSMII